LQALTGLLYSGYGPPGDFCYDIFCNPVPVQVWQRIQYQLARAHILNLLLQDDPNLFDYNVQWVVDTFGNYINWSED
jgi:hypothetical protein